MNKTLKAILSIAAIAVACWFGYYKYTKLYPPYEAPKVANPGMLPPK